MCSDDVIGWLVNLMVVMLSIDGSWLCGIVSGMGFGLLLVVGCGNVVEWVVWNVMLFLIFDMI